MIPTTPFPAIRLGRRGLLGAFALAVALPRAAGAQPAPAAGNPLEALLALRADGTALFLCPYTEGGQGVFTAMAQIIGEELDLEPGRFVVEAAPPGPAFTAPRGARITGGSQSVRNSYQAMRLLGATARRMLMQAAAAQWNVPLASLTTQPGRVLHAPSGRALDYAALAAAAARLPVPADPPLRDPAAFRWIGKPVARLDALAKSTGQARYGIDQVVEGMLQAAIQHAPRLGMEPGALANEAAVRAMPGVHSIHRLPGAVAVLADRWWRARRAVETLEVRWSEAAPGGAMAMPADFSSAALRDRLAATPGPGLTTESTGDAPAALQGAARVLEAVYDAPFLAHGQLEPPSAVASWHAADRSLELWVPNQAQDMFQRAAAEVAGVPPEKVTLHSPLLGGFFGRHFLYPSSSPFPQAILLSQAVNRPVKVIWSREEEFLRDSLRPIGLARFRGALDARGMPLAIEAEAVNDHLLGRVFGAPMTAADRTMVEGIQGKPYAIPHRRVAHVLARYPAMIGAWRSVGHSMNDFFSESFLDEMADAGGQDPFALRLRLLEGSPRHQALLRAVGELSGGWRRGPFEVEGTRRARGVAMASPFGSEVATIAEVSIRDGEVVVHDVWVAIDPGSIVNPAIIEAQVQSAVALGTSITLLEEVVYENGMPRARNFDGYPILPPGRMPRVHVRIVESGAPMGGIGEPGLPGVPPAVANAVAALTGQRIRSLPLSRTRLGTA